MVAMFGPAAGVEFAWIATRQKALLTTRDRAQLADLRNAYGSDPHIAALIDALLI